MGDTDPFGDLVKGCRELGMAVMARTDPHSIRQDAYDAHPEWVQILADGTPRRHWADPTRWVTCPLGPYNFEFMTESHARLSISMASMRFLAIVGPGTVFATANTASATSLKPTAWSCHVAQIPRTRPIVAILVWRNDRLFELWDVWEQNARTNPDARYIPNSGGGALAWIDMKRAGEKAASMVADRQSRGGLLAPWAVGKNGKEYRSVLGSKQVIEMFGVGIEGNEYRWKDSVQHEPELRIWIANAIANGMDPLFIKFSLTLHDHRWLPVIEDVFTGITALRPICAMKNHWRMSDWFFRNKPPHIMGARRTRKNGRPYQGFYQALIEARIPFEMVHEDLLDADHIDQFKTLVLPNIAALSDDQCQQIRDYVNRGGSLVVTHETSLYDEWGQRRDDFGLADVLGVHFGGEVQGP